MYEPGFRGSRIYRLLNTSWPLFTAFGVRVSISWTITIWPLLFLWSFGAVTDAGLLGTGAAIGWAFAWTIGLFASVYTHEMGHIVMGRRCGVETREMTLRGLGGLAHMESNAQSPRDEMKISLAGPATHLLWCAVLYPAVWLSEDALTGDGASFESVFAWWMLDGFATLQVSLMIFNLLPVYPMDGGRVLRGALAERMHANLATLHTSTVGFVGNGLMIVLGLLGWTKTWDPFGYGPFGFLLVWIGISGVLACRQLRRVARHGEVYAAHDPFQQVLRESEAAMRALDAVEAKERRRAEKAQRERAKVDAERDALQTTVDRLLDRITEVGGVDRLPAAERRELERASERLRDLG